MIKFIKWTGVILLSLLLFAVVSIFVLNERYLLNPIQREIVRETKLWSNLVDLDIKKLNGQEIQVAERWILSKGFEKTTGPSLVSYIEYEKTEEKNVMADHHFVKWSGNIACDLRFVVLLYDDGKKITRARGMFTEAGCL